MDEGTSQLRVHLMQSVPLQKQQLVWLHILATIGYAEVVSRWTRYLWPIRSSRSNVSCAFVLVPPSIVCLYNGFKGQHIQWECPLMETEEQTGGGSIGPGDCQSKAEGKFKSSRLLRMSPADRITQRKANGSRELRADSPSVMRQLYLSLSVCLSVHMFPIIPFMSLLPYGELSFLAFRFPGSTREYGDTFQTNSSEEEDTLH